MTNSTTLPTFALLSKPTDTVRDHAGGQNTDVPRSTSALHIQLASAIEFASVSEHWTALAARAAVPNVFMDPAVALAYAESWPDPVRILLAWQSEQEHGAEAQLVGAWLLVERVTRLSWPWKVLVSPPGPVAYLGTPVIDRDYVAPVLAAMLQMIRETPGLPKLVQAGDMSGGSLVMEALSMVQAGSSVRARLLETRRRAKLISRDDPKAFWVNSMSARRLQGFARKRRQLGKEGKLVFACVDDPEAVAAGLEEFLRLEASGWKAVRQSALACDAAIARFTRRMVAELAQRRLVSVQSLRLDGVPIAMWVVLFSGSAAYTWRTAYDEAYRRFSPGVLLLEDTTAHLAMHPGISFTDSCNHRDVGHQAERWPERHEVHDLLIDAGSDRPLRLLMLSSREKTIRNCRETARQLYHQLRRALNNASRRFSSTHVTKPVE